ncbi:MAG TPA: MATE family efflux transporter [Caulobacteraceae bacterium]|nr:MATE family efflux transporter [Caulobacteraceae bacterium]
MDMAPSDTPPPRREARPHAGGRRGAAMSRELTEGPITKTLLTFALPVLGGNALQTLNTSVNQFWVAHTLGITAITAIGNSNTLMMLMVGAVFGISMAANILIAQQVGADDLAMAKRVMGTAITFFLVLSVGLALLGWHLAPLVLDAMRTPASARADAIIYLRVMFAAMPFTYFFMFLQMAQRGVGDSHTPFYFMILAAGLDMILNPCLIMGLGPFPKLGIAGSATSTLIAQSISLLLLMALLYRRHSVLMLRPSEMRLLKPDFRVLKSLVTRGLPMGFQMFVMSGASVVMIGFVNGYGPLVAAAYVAALPIWTYLQMPGMAIGASISSMAAQNIGAGRWDRVNRVAVSGLVCSLLVTSVLAVLLYALGPIPLYIFLPFGSKAIPIALHIDRITLWAFVLFNATFALSGVVRSTGAVIPPLIILIISMWAIRVPFAWALTPRFGAEAIWWSFPLGTITSSTLTALYYFFGGWRKVRMLEPEAGGQAPDAGQGVPAMDPHDIEEASAAAS